MTYEKSRMEGCFEGERIVSVQGKGIHLQMTKVKSSWKSDWKFRHRTHSISEAGLSNRS